MKDYFGYAPAVIIPRVISAAILLIFAQVLSPHEIGLYSMVIIYGEYLDTIFCRWIRSGYTRLYFTFRDRGRPIDRAIIILTVPGILLSILFSFAYATYDPELGVQWALMLALYVTANFILYQGLQFLRVRGSRTLYVLVEASRSIVGFFIALATMHIFTPSYTWLLLSTQIITLAISVWLLIKMIFVDGESHIRKDELFEIMKYSSPLLISFFLAGTTLVVDRFMLEKLAGPAYLGVYAVSYQIARPALDVLFNTINIGGYPKLIAAYENEGVSGAGRVLYQKNVAIALVTIPVLFVILFTSDQISNLFLKGDYAKYAPMTLSLVAISSFLRGWVRFMVDQVFMVCKSTIDQIWNLVPSLIVTVVAAFVFIPKYGVYGAAGSAALGSMVETIVAVIRARRLMHFRIIGNEVWIILVLCIFGSAIIWLSSKSFGVYGWLTALICVGVVYLYSIRKFGIFRFLRV